MCQYLQKKNLNIIGTGVYKVKGANILFSRGGGEGVFD